MNQVLVYLVGAGPGDPGLITVAGAATLQHADVVVYDYLANRQLLSQCPPEAELIYVGKSGNQHTKTQDEINQILVDKALELRAKSPAGKTQRLTVVRLKGGDPYVFGRGGEEGEFLRARGIDFVEIPGITSGIAAPAYAGIPVTHRDFTSTITLITGHEKESTEASETDSRVNYEALAKLNGTLVFYMGVKGLPTIVERLVAGGLDPATPAAVIRWGTHPHQQTVTGTLASIVEVVRNAGITAPAITVIGKVVSLRDTLNWFERQPLFGQRILVTRTRQQSSELTAQLAALGAQVIEAPTIALEEPDDWTEIDRSLQQIPAYDWVVFTSANGVRAAWRRLRELTFDTRHFGASNIAAIGPATAEALEEIGIVPDVIPEKFVGEELAAAIKTRLGDEEVRHKRFLLLRADIARPALREALEKLGATVDDLAVYHTVKPVALPEDVLTAIRDGQIDWITFTSASTAVNLHEMLPADLRETAGKISRLSIGPITTTALKELGWPPTVEADAHDIPGMVEALVEHIGKK